MNRRAPGMIRDRVLARVLDMLEHLRIQVSMLPELDIEVLRKLERPQQYDLGVEISDCLMERLGHITAPSDPRFNKTRRAMAKKTKGPRGVPKSRPALPEEIVEEPANG